MSPRRFLNLVAEAAGERPELVREGKHGLYRVRGRSFTVPHGEIREGTALAKLRDLGLR